MHQISGVEIGLPELSLQHLYSDASDKIIEDHWRLKKWLYVSCLGQLDQSQCIVGGAN